MYIYLTQGNDIFEGENTCSLHTHTHTHIKLCKANEVAISFWVNKWETNIILKEKIKGIWYWWQ